LKGKYLTFQQDLERIAKEREALFPQIDSAMATFKGEKEATAGDAERSAVSQFQLTLSSSLKTSMKHATPLAWFTAIFSKVGISIHN
jgi:hypothetical protein